MEDFFLFQHISHKKEGRMDTNSIRIFYKTSQETVGRLSEWLRPVASAMVIRTVGNTMYLEVTVDDQFFNFTSCGNGEKEPEAGRTSPAEPALYGGDTWD